MGSELIPYSDIEKMGTAIAKSKLFGLNDPTQALALMLVAQAEGLHPAVAARDYHIIEGRPALKADAMLSRFQERGGVVQWDELTDTRVVGVFSHPQSCPKPVRIEWTIERAKTAEVYREKTSTGKTGMWVKYPRQMLRARVISEGVRTSYPLACNGMYVPEEVQDFDDKPKPRETTAVVVTTQEPATPQHQPTMTHEEFVAPLPKPLPKPPQREPGQDEDEFEKAINAEESGSQQQTQQQVQEPSGDDRLISDPQAKRLFAIMKSAGKTIEEVKAIVAVFGYTNSRDIKRKDYAAICAEVEKPKA